MYVHNESTLIRAVLFSKPRVDSFTAYPQTRRIFSLKFFYYCFLDKKRKSTPSFIPNYAVCVILGRRVRVTTQKGWVGEHSLPAFFIVSLVCLSAKAMLPKAPL